MAGEHQGEQLVAQLAVGERLAVLGARLQQQREDVAALVEVRRRGGASRSPRRSAGRAAPSPALVAPTGSSLPTFMSSASWATGQVEAATRRLTAWRSQCSGVPARGPALDAEDPGHDHVERDRLHPRRERERLAERPARRSRARWRRRSSARSGRSPRRGTAAAAACAGACGAAPIAVSTEFGPTIGRSGDSPVSDGACSGLAVNSERTWSGWLVITGSPPIVPRIRKTSPSSAPGAEDELDLALVEAQHLERARAADRRRRAQAVELGRRRAGRPATAGPRRSTPRPGALGRSWTRTTMTSTKCYIVMCVDCDLGAGRRKLEPWARRRAARSTTRSST